MEMAWVYNRVPVSEKVRMLEGSYPTASQRNRTFSATRTIRFRMDP
jgi:hypothetical protein